MTGQQFYDWQTAGGAGDVTLLVDTLAKLDVNWCMISSLAVNHWAEEPMATADVDLVVALDAITETVAALEEMHYLKTGRLITASLQLGYFAAEVEDATLLGDLNRFGDSIGRAFQIQDDILDITAGTEQLGKPSGSDQKLQKSTFPSLLGLAQSQQRARELCQQAQQTLAGYGESAQPLQQLAQYIISRDH